MKFDDLNPMSKEITMTNIINGWDVEYWECYLHQITNNEIHYNTDSEKLSDLTKTQQLLAEAEAKYNKHILDNADFFI